MIFGRYVVLDMQNSAQTAAEAMKAILGGPRTKLMARSKERVWEDRCRRWLPILCCPAVLALMIGMGLANAPGVGMGVVCGTFIAVLKMVRK
jgi:hypothetical protein